MSVASNKLLDGFSLQFNALVLKGLRRGISLIYNRIEKLNYSEDKAIKLFKNEIDRVALVDLCPEIFNTTTELYQSGIKLDWNIEHTKALNILRNNNVFLVSKYYDSLPGVVETISQSFQEGGKNKDLIVRQLRENFKPIVKTSTGYNNMLVNTVGATARVISQVNEMSEYGAQYSKIIGQRDELTCPICMKLIGRVFKVSEQKKVADAYLSVDYSNGDYEKGIEKLKEVKPWLTIKDVKYLDKPNYNNYLENYQDTKKIITNNAMRMPIYHAHCRCETMIINEL